MSTIRVSRALAVIAAAVLSALPVYAQDDRRGAGDGQDRPRAERRRPRAEGGGQNNDGRRAQAGRPRRDDAPRAEAPRDEGPGREAPRAEAVPRADRGPRNENRDTDRNNNNNNNRGNDRGNDRGWNASRNGNWDRDGDRDHDRNLARDRRAVPRGNSRDGWRNDRGRDVYRYQPPSRGYRNYSRPSRVWVVPYGYRPRGYNRGWNVNLYFGNAYGYGRPGYYRGGGSGYGYYALPPGFAYGSLRIVDAPRYAPVFVDGYYAGEVDDYDGIFQRLNLEPGRHLVEVDVYPGAPPLEYEVFIEPGRTVTIHVR